MNNDDFILGVIQHTLGIDIDDARKIKKMGDDLKTMSAALHDECATVEFFTNEWKYELSDDGELLGVSHCLTFGVEKNVVVLTNGKSCYHLECGCGAVLMLQPKAWSM